MHVNRGEVLPNFLVVLTVHVLPYMFTVHVYCTRLTDFRLELQVLEQETVLLYTFYHTCFTHFWGFSGDWSKELLVATCTFHTFFTDFRWHATSVPYSFIIHNSLKLHVNCTHWTVFCSIAMAQNVQEVSWASQQQVAHNSCWEQQTSHRLLFLFFFALFTPDMNSFVIDFIVCNVATHMQRFSSGILMIFFEKLCVKCEGIWINMWLPCRVNMQHSVWESWLTCGSHARLTCSIQCVGGLDLQISGWSYKYWSKKLCYCTCFTIHVSHVFEDFEVIGVRNY